MLKTAQSDTSTTFSHEYWSSRLGFVLAATGSAVGLGNIWRFPYITGENGGGAFVLVYLICIALIGLPIMMAEALIGRRGGQSPIHSIAILAKQEGRSAVWQGAGWSGVIASLIILSFYSVIGGWSIAYVFYAATGTFEGLRTHGINGLFSEFLGRPGVLLLWHSVFMVLTISVVARGVKGGLERAVTWLMPLLFALMVVFVGYAALSTGQFMRAVEFLFRPDFSRLGPTGVVSAMGQAFFSLSVGASIIIAYGSYLPREISIARATVTISIADTLVAMLAGLAIFPIVFASTLVPGEGPGLIFQTLPLAFAQMPGGAVFGTLFFVLLVIAAWTSSISLLEPGVEWLLEHRGVRRAPAAWAIGAGVWALGIVTILSFNRWEDVKLFGKTVFDLLDYLASNIMLPINGLLFALFAGWMMAKASTQDELGMGEGIGYTLWHFLVRFIAPIGVVLVFLYSVGVIG